MQLVEIKKEGALGGRLTPDGKNVVVAIKEGGNTIVEIIEATAEIVGEIIEKATPLYHQIKAFFDDIFNLLPTFIIHEGVKYRLTLFPAGGKEADYVAYLSIDMEELFSKFNREQSIKIFMATSAQTLSAAKNGMQHSLKEKGYIL